tara:strand:- start:373 stop:816 length:444 start_codon:yes stop_codon:yes gene_type:complete
MLLSKKYKHKYQDLRDIYYSVRDKLKIKSRWSKSQKKHLKKNISWTLYRDIVYKFLEILFDEVINKKELVHLPNAMGYIYLSKKKNKRPFHIRVDVNESNKQGKLVKYKVPILDDYYYKIDWKRSKEYSSCKIMPLTRIKNMIKCQE